MNEKVKVGDRVKLWSADGNYEDEEYALFGEVVGTLYTGFLGSVQVIWVEFQLSTGRLVRLHFAAYDSYHWRKV